MSKFEEVVAAATAQLTTDAGEGSIDATLVEAVAKGLGPSIYNADASTVSCSDSEELSRVRESFVKGKLGVDASDETIDAAITSACQTLGTSNRHKLRVAFYYLLTKHFGKESVYAA